MFFTLLASAAPQYPYIAVTRTFNDGSSIQMTLNSQIAFEESSEIPGVFAIRNLKKAPIFISAGPVTKSIFSDIADMVKQEHRITLVAKASRLLQLTINQDDVESAGFLITESSFYKIDISNLSFYDARLNFIHNPFVASITDGEKVLIDLRYTAA